VFLEFSLSVPRWFFGYGRRRWRLPHLIALPALEEEKKKKKREGEGSVAAQLMSICFSWQAGSISRRREIGRTASFQLGDDYPADPRPKEGEGKKGKKKEAPSAADARFSIQCHSR